MSLMLCTVQSCGKCFRHRGLRILMASEADGYTYFRRFRWKHKFAGKFLEEAVNKHETSSMSDRSKPHNKVFLFMQYDEFHDQDKKAVAGEFPWKVESALDDFHVTLACQRFPSITIGSSTSLELYDESACSDVISHHSQPRQFDNCFTKPASQESVAQSKLSEPEIWPLFPALTTMISPDVKDNSTLTLHTEDKNAKSYYVEDYSSYTVEEIGKPMEIVLDKPISCIAGVSKRHCRQLDTCGFHTLRKLLHHFPRTYAEAQNPHTGIVDGQYLIFFGRITSSKGVRASYSFSFMEIVVSGEITDDRSSSKTTKNGDENCGNRTIYLHLKKFFRGARFTSQPFLRSLEQKHKVGDLVCVSGKVRNNNTEGHYEMREYSLDVIEDEYTPSAFIEKRPYPIYPSKGGLKAEFLRDIIRSTLKHLPYHVDPIPQDITAQFGLLPLYDAYLAIHQPKDLNEADFARRRFIFDEFFYLQLGRLYQMLEGLGSQIEIKGLLEKYQNPVHNAVFIEEWSSLSKKFLESLPYSLTPGQLNSASEIIWDLKQPIPMNRLLQGDVGCGKTIVAFLACMEVLGSGYQAAFMVPTELLAIQHYEHLQNLLDKLEFDQKPSVALLTGSTPTRQARMIRQGLQNGDISLVIGTHTLIAGKVEFSMLRLAVIDEQHRFGVIQRGLFNSKLYNTGCKLQVETDLANDTPKSLKQMGQMAPHVLAMSATPIPRTLALALYGDMSLTNITDLPPGRTPVETHIMEGDEAGFLNVYEMMLSELQSGGKVYLVYPVIEVSEQLPQLHAASADIETISAKFPDYKCGLLHGKMKGDEKEEALRRFRVGETPILLSTQVIEIGVDVPDASMMVVMNAERFGIAQLHQLRGRVGRGERKSKCILLAATATSLSRLSVLEKSSDGFHLANIDLLLRGPGDLLGKKQSGHLPEFPIARLEMDGNILQEAHTAALKILGRSHDLDQFPELKTELSMRQPLSLLGD